MGARRRYTDNIQAQNFTYRLHLTVLLAQTLFTFREYKRNIMIAYRERVVALPRFY